ncbi:hypothetical protein AB7M16_005198 [Bradyrhizobium sp. USDA 372]
MAVPSRDDLNATMFQDPGQFGAGVVYQNDVRRDRKDVDIYVKTGQQQIVILVSWGITFEWFGRDYQLRIASGKQSVTSQDRTSKKSSVDARSR